MRKGRLLTLHVEKNNALVFALRGTLHPRTPLAFSQGWGDCLYPASGGGWPRTKLGVMRCGALCIPALPWLLDGIEETRPRPCF